MFIVHREGQDYGPYTLEVLKTLLASGTVIESDYLRATDSSEWSTVGAFLANLPPVIASAPTIPEVTSEPPVFPVQNKPAKGGCFRQGCIISVVVVLILIVGFFGLAMLGALTRGVFDDDSSGKAKDQPTSTGTPKTLNSEAQDTKTSFTKDEWKVRLGKAFPIYASNGVIVPGVRKSDFIKVCGSPDRTETIGDDTFWYYECTDGEIQLCLMTQYIRSGVVVVERTNDF